MAAIALNASWHYVMMGVKDRDLDEDLYARPLVSIRQTGFEDGNEIETETDEGHTGVSNLDMGSYRTTAESAPTWEDKFRYSEGLEDIFYLLLGNYTKLAHGSTDGVYDYHFELPADNTTELPVATIYNGFQKTETDARAFNNALLNELEITFSADDAPTIAPTFVSDYNNFNLMNPTRGFLEESHFAKAAHTQVYVGHVGATAKEMMRVPIDCFSEASLTINHNAESQSCHDDAFGKNTKIMGARETEGSITMPWVDGTKLFETEYEAFNKYGHSVSEEITHKQVWFRCYGGDIIRVSKSDTVGTGEKIVSTKVIEEEGQEVTYYYISTGVPYETIIKCPDCELTSVTSPKSGDEAKDLTMEFKVLEKPTQSYITVDMVTDLADLHIDTTGAALNTFYPDPSKYTDFAEN